MISYEVYKVIHVFSVVALALLGGMVMVSDGMPKAVKITIGTFSFLILVGGMGLLARIGVSHGSGFPGWVVAKMAIWLALAGLFGYVSKRGASNKMMIGGTSGVLFLGAIFLAVFKTF